MLRVYLALIVIFIRRAGSTCPSVPNPPQGSICGVTGTVANPDPQLPNATPWACTTLIQCRDKCVAETGQTPGCKSFTWDPNSTPPCIFYYQTIAAQGFTPSPPGPPTTTTWYDNACYACACHPNPPLLDNYNFDSPSSNLSPWVPGDPVYASSVPAGPPHGHVARLDCQGQQGGGQLYLLQEFYACAGQAYTVTFDYRVLNSAAARFKVYFCETGVSGPVCRFVAYSHNAPFASGWQTVSSASYTFDVTSAFVYFYVVCQSGLPKFLIDNVVVS